MGKGAVGMVAPPTVGHMDSLPCTKRSFNFSAGPAMLDTEAMLSMHRDFISFQGSGVSLIEMSQRDVGGPVQHLIATACGNIRELLDVPDNYRILLFQGGAHGQFAGVPLNLCGDKHKAQYVDGGFWSRRAASEASKYCTTAVCASTYRCPVTGLLRYPDPKDWNLDSDAAYVHIVTNETIDGVEMGDPDVGEHVLVSDMTSTLLSRPVDVSKYGVIYASGGKNLGPAGVCVVIVRDDLLDRASSLVPSFLSWKVMHDANNLYNTQCTFAIWAMKTITDNLLRMGGLPANAKKVAHRALRFYAVIDSSNGFYVNTVHPEFRSRMSIPFRILDNDEDLEQRFSSEGFTMGLHQLSGHHSAGGLRVCIYNGIPDEGLDLLITFMEQFRAKYDIR